MPYDFTEQGVAMLSSVLRSKRAVEVNIEIVRAFVRLRQLLSANRELAQKLAQLEGKIGSLENSRNVEVSGVGLSVNGDRDNAELIEGIM